MHGDTPQDNDARPRARDPAFVLRDAALRARLVEAAIRAPSGDNCQPWHFRFHDDRVDIDVLAERAESFFDYGYRGTLLSVGAVVENLRIQAACEALSSTVAYPPGVGFDPLPRPAASVALRPGAPADARSRDRRSALERRTVNRRPFLPLGIAADRQRAWLEETVPGSHVDVISDRRRIARWARVVYLADRIRWTHPTLHAEVFASIRFNGAEARSARTGLEIDRLGAGPLALPIMRLLEPWQRMSRLNRCGVDRLLAQQARALVRLSGALVLVTIDKDDPAHWIRAGEQVERLWVLAQLQRLCVQPMPVALYFDQRFQREGATGFLPHHRPLLDQLRRELADLLGTRTGAMVYRVGRGMPMRGTAVRLPPASFYDDGRT